MIAKRIASAVRAGLVSCAVASIPVRLTNAQTTVMDTGSYASASRSVPMREVSLRATVDPTRRQVNASVTTHIATPFGPIPLRSHIAAVVDCAGAFSGTISFHPLVRVLARIKGIALATNVEGYVVRDISKECLTLPSDTVRGTAKVDRKVIRGQLRGFGDSADVVGHTWMVADTAYHGQLRVTSAVDTTEVRVTVYERGRKRHN